MQQLFDEYISNLTRVYSNVLEEVGMLSKLMSGRLYAKDDALLKQVARLDQEIPLLKQKYPQFAYLTEYVFESEDMFDAVKRSMAISPEIFPQYEKGKNILTPVLLAKLSHIATENDCNFILNYLEKNNVKESCWKECFANIYKNHPVLRIKVRDMFLNFLERTERLVFPCGEDVISIFDGTPSSVRDVMMLLEKIYKKTDPNYDFFAEKMTLDKVNFFHHCFLKDVPREYIFARMLYHTRYLNAAEFSVAYKSMGISKMLEYDFSLAQRILPRLLSYLSKIPYQEAVDVIRRNKILDAHNFYSENERWLSEAALTLAEVFGVKYDTYLKRVLPFMNLCDATSFIKNIEYLVKYGGEPEIEIIVKDGKKIFIIAYEDFIDFYDENDNYQKLDNIKQAVEKIDFANILDIIEDGGMDLSRPIEEQSMLVDGKLFLTPSR